MWAGLLLMDGFFPEGRLSYSSKDHQPRGVPTNYGLGPPPSLIKKMPYSLPTSQSYKVSFSAEVPSTLIIIAFVNLT